MPTTPIFSRRRMIRPSASCMFPVVNEEPLGELERTGGEWSRTWCGGFVVGVPIVSVHLDEDTTSTITRTSPLFHMDSCVSSPPKLERLHERSIPIVDVGDPVLMVSTRGLLSCVHVDAWRSLSIVSALTYQVRCVLSWLAYRRRSRVRVDEKRESSAWRKEFASEARNYSLTRWRSTSRICPWSNKSFSFNSYYSTHDRTGTWAEANQVTSLDSTEEYVSMRMDDSGHRATCTRIDRLVCIPFHVRIC